MTAWETHQASANSDSQLKDQLTRYERKEHLSAWVLIVSLFAEAISDFVFRDGKSMLETFTFIILGLVVTLSVAGEVWFANRGSNIQSELDRRSAEKVAKLTLQAAKANEKAAALEKEAAVMRERAAEIERLTAWRRVPWKQHQFLVSALEEKASVLKVLIEYEKGDPEAFSYAEAIAKIFFAIDAKVDAIALTHAVPMFGLYMQISPELKELGIAEIFASADFPVVANVEEISSTNLPKGLPPPNIFIWVGGKPPLSFTSTGGDNP